MCQQVIKKNRQDQQRRHCSCSTCTPAVSQAGIGAKEPSTMRPQQDIWLGIWIHWESLGVSCIMSSSAQDHASTRQFAQAPGKQTDLPIRAETKQNAEKPRAKATNDICWYCSQQLRFQHGAVSVPLFNRPLFCLFHAVAHARPRGRRMQVLEERMELKASVS